MKIVRGAALILVGIAIGFAATRLRPHASSLDAEGEVATRLADLDQRLSRLERTMSIVPTHLPTTILPEGDHLQETVSRLQEQVASLTHTAALQSVSMSPGDEAHQPIEDSSAIARRDSEPWSRARGLDARQLEYVVTEVVASLTPKYLEEQVSQLYAAQKQADQDAQQETEQRRRAEMQERRLAQLINDLQTFVPGLSLAQTEEVGQVIREQWEVMGVLRQQAAEQAALITPGEILQKARELTDEKLYTILSGPQADAFRLWRETRFGFPAGISRQ